MIFELPSPDTGYGYTEEFLKTFLMDWPYFTKNWMSGKTYAVIDGKKIYYVHNVINYIRQVHKKEPVFTGRPQEDTQQAPVGWDKIET